MPGESGERRERCQTSSHAQSPARGLSAASPKISVAQRMAPSEGNGQTHPSRKVDAEKV